MMLSIIASCIHSTSSDYCCDNSAMLCYNIIYLYYLLCFVVCTYMESKYQENDVIRPNCSARCVCQNGTFNCLPQLCSIDGDICLAYGETHYYTFDQRYYQFQGDCGYVLAQSCNATEFAVIATNNAESHFIRVVVPGENLDILLGRGGGGTVTINDIPQANNGDEVILTSGGVEVVRIGGHPHVILTELGVRVSWDGLYHVEVTVSTSWRGRLCGLCGNYNGNPDDDFMTPDGSLELLPNEFGSSWVWNNGTQGHCGGVLSPSTCPTNIMAEAQERCAVLREQSFNECYNLVNPSSFTNSCIYDYCHCKVNSREDCYCNILAIYGAVCSTKGITAVMWNTDFCSKFINVIGLIESHSIITALIYSTKH